MRDVNLGVLPVGNRSYDDIMKCVMIAYDKGQNDLKETVLQIAWETLPEEWFEKLEERLKEL